MLSEKDAVNLDNILKLLLEKTPRQVLNAPAVNIAVPEISKEQAQYYFSLLNDHRPRIVTTAFSRPPWDDTMEIYPTDFTSKFLGDGGFKQIYNDQQASITETKTDQTLQRENWIATTKNAKISLILSAIAIAISIVAVILQIIGKQG